MVFLLTGILKLTILPLRGHRDGRAQLTGCTTAQQLSIPYSSQNFFLYFPCQQPGFSWFYSILKLKYRKQLKSPVQTLMKQNLSDPSGALKSGLHTRLPSLA